jgi:hypothetical protein
VLDGDENADLHRRRYVGEPNRVAVGRVKANENADHAGTLAAVGVAA